MVERMVGMAIKPKAMSRKLITPLILTTAETTIIRKTSTGKRALAEKKASALHDVIGKTEHGRKGEAKYAGQQKIGPDSGEGRSRLGW